MNKWIYIQQQRKTADNNGFPTWDHLIDLVIRAAETMSMHKQPLFVCICKVLHRLSLALALQFSSAREVNPSNSIIAIADSKSFGSCSLLAKRRYKPFTAVAIFCGHFGMTATRQVSNRCKFHDPIHHMQSFAKAVACHSSQRFALGFLAWRTQLGFRTPSVENVTNLITANMCSCTMG